MVRLLLLIFTTAILFVACDNPTETKERVLTRFNVNPDITKEIRVRCFTDVSDHYYDSIIWVISDTEVYTNYGSILGIDYKDKNNEINCFDIHTIKFQEIFISNAK